MIYTYKVSFLKVLFYILHYFLLIHRPQLLLGVGYCLTLTVRWTADL
jgi:hypothetical protein